MNKRYYVGGMTCSACANGIEKIVKGISGVKSAEVSLMSKSLDVELSYDLDVATIETEIFSKVTALGYTISKEREEIVKSQKSKNITKITSLICLLLLLPLIYLCLEESFSFQLFDKEISLIIQGVLALAIIILNFSFYTRGVRALIKGVANMDTLVFLSSSLSYIFSVIITILYILKIISIPKVFFEASAMVLVFISIGKWIEEVCKVKTGKEAEKLYSLVPKTALVVKDGEEKIVEIDNLNAGDLLIFKSGDFITVDGIVTSGNAFIDNSSITGESIAVEVYKESEVLSGGIVKNGYIIVKALKVSKDTLFSKIIECAQEAGKSKPPIQRLADKIAGIFVPIVSAIAVVVFVIWMIVSKDVFTSFTHAISVLVVSCPCALGLATPVAILAVSFKGLSVGVLYKNAESVHKISQINCVLLDKTATLTEGQPKVVSFKNYSNKSDKELLSIAYQLENMSNHPFASAIMEYSKEGSGEVSQYDYVIGRGIIAIVDGEKYYLGNAKICPFDFKEEQNSKDLTKIYLFNDEKLLFTFYIKDGLKKDAKRLVKKLINSNFELAIISGDNSDITEAIAKELGIEKYYSSVLPSEKHEIVKSYQERGYKVCMCGDGINDSLALKQADVGISFLNASDVAIESADTVLLSGDIMSVIDSINLGKKAYRIIKGNLFWAFIYNILLIPIASGAMTPLGITLSPTISSICMSLSSIFVVTNATRITNFRRENQIKYDYKLEIQGMMCKHCEKTVCQILSRNSQITAYNVNLEKGNAEIAGSPNCEELAKDINQKGFNITSIKKI